MDESEDQKGTKGTRSAEFSLSRQNDGSSEEAASFVAEAIGDLLIIAKRHGLDTLCYLLDMALLEAEEARKRPRR